jgi:hypothetical protein
LRYARALSLLGVLFFLATASAVQSANDGALRSEDEVTLVVHTAADCPICKAWRESSSGLAVAQRLPKESPPVRVVLVERPSLHGSESAALYPADLQFLFKARQEKYQLSPAAPLFELVRGEQIISRHAGLRGWTEGTLPEVRHIQGQPASSSSGRKD